MEFAPRICGWSLQSRIEDEHGQNAQVAKALIRDRLFGRLGLSLEND
jgi:hypothetical protein